MYERQGQQCTVQAFILVEHEQAPKSRGKFIEGNESVSVRVRFMDVLHDGLGGDGRVARQADVVKRVEHLVHVHMAALVCIVLREDDHQHLISGGLILKRRF